MKFKAGDKVRALETAGYDYIKNEIYEVKYCTANRTFTVTDSRGSLINGWGSRFFELVEEKQDTIHPALLAYKRLYMSLYKG